MSAPKSLLTVFAALLIGGGYAATAPGCVIQLTDCDECDEEAVCHSYLATDGMCYCDAGYEWADGSGDNFNCTRIPPRDDVDACVNPHNVAQGGQCYCACGWTWCTDDASDLTCCEQPSNCEESATDVIEPSTGEPGDSSGSSGTTGTTTAGTTGTSSGGSTAEDDTAAETAADDSGTADSSGG
jgi:hypothetical protein